MTVAALHQLERLAHVALQSAEARMAALRAAEASLHARLRALDRDLAARGAELGKQTDPAWISGVDLRWQQWVEQHRRALWAELARLRVLQDQAQAALALAFGRHLATEKLACDAARAARQSQARRAL